MMRSLYTAATGMIAQQTNLDTISNNLSNVNTTGYKTIRRGRVKRQRSRPILHWKERDSLPCGVWMDRHITPETVTSPGVRIRMETQFWQPQRGFRYWIPEEIPFVCQEAYLRKAWYFRAMERLAIKMQPAMSCH